MKSVGLVVVGFAFLETHAALAFRDPDEVEFFASSGSFRVDFQWNTDPGFGKGQAAEFQLVVNDKCFGAPVGGKDISVGFGSGRVDSNLSSDGNLRA